MAVYYLTARYYIVRVDIFADKVFYGNIILDTFDPIVTYIYCYYYLLRAYRYKLSSVSHTY